jgi:nucleotide sugar dehydrogenase
MNVTVVGAGKMGLPLACVFASNGAHVTAADLDRRVVESINSGKVPFDEPGLSYLLAAAVASGTLRATTDTSSAVAVSDVVVVIVPALLTVGKDADLSILVSASRSIAEALRPGTLVSYETTVPIGSTRNCLGPTLAASGLVPGEDFDLVFSPERVKSQHVLESLSKNLKVVGGITPAAAERGTEFYSTYLRAPVQNVGSLEAAEFVKLGGMIYRDVNIGLANQLAEYAEAVGIDFTELIGAINSDGEAALLSPGIGVGGHCTPVYPHFYLRDAERKGLDHGIAREARAVNDGQAKRALDRVEETWGSLSDSEVLILGLGFRPGVKEDAFSTTYLLSDELESRGAIAKVHDPLFSDKEIASRNLRPANLTDVSLPPVAILVTAHPQYVALDLQDLANRGTKVLVDGRNLWDPVAVEAVGLTYIGMGRPKPAEERSSGLRANGAARADGD